MFLFNLGLGELLGLIGLSSGIVVAIYMLDRTRRAIVVSTLQFWIGSDRPIDSSRRRRVQQWPSLLIQLLAILLLLLAIAQLRIGSPDTTSLDHVVLLDTSAWMDAAPDGAEPFIAQVRTQALRYVRALPATDRVMIAYADALTAPQTSFESDRAAVETAIRRARASASALNLRQAIEFASQTLKRSARRPGEIVIVGGLRPGGERGLPEQYPKNLRVLAIEGNPENVGIRRVGVRPTPEDEGVWRVFVLLRNYGRRPQTADLLLSFGGAPAGSLRADLAPGAESEATFDYRTRATGVLEIRVRSANDGFAADDRAAVELTGLGELAVTVCSDEPQALRPLLRALPSITPTYRSRVSCAQTPPDGPAVYDRMAPETVDHDALLIEPPAGRSPIPVAKTAAGATLTSWRPDHPVAAGIRTANFPLDSAEVFSPGAEDRVVAASDAGPVIVARQTDKARIVAMGFHPMHSAIRREVSTPLLFANVFRWFAPRAFGRSELVASSVGAVAATVSENSQVQVLDDRGISLPFARNGQVVRFFTGSMGTVRVVETTGAVEREQVYSLTLPEVPDADWQPPAAVLRGAPPPRGILSGSADIWPWLVAAASILLFLDWLWYAPGARTTRMRWVQTLRRAA